MHCLFASPISSITLIIKTPISQGINFLSLKETVGVCGFAYNDNTNLALGMDDEFCDYWMKIEQETRRNTYTHRREKEIEGEEEGEVEGEVGERWREWWGSGGIVI